MDSDPLVPTEISPTKKYLMLGCVGLVAIFILITLILLIVKAKQFHHNGMYVCAIGLFALTATVVMLNIFLPQDYMDNRAKYTVMALNICLVLIAIGFLIHAFEKTPHPPCPPVNTCTMTDVGEGGWFQKPDCFQAERNKTFITISNNRTCPPPGEYNDSFQLNLDNYEPKNDSQFFPELEIKA